MLVTIGISYSTLNKAKPYLSPLCIVLIIVAITSLQTELGLFGFSNRYHGQYYSFVRALT